MAQPMLKVFGTSNTPGILSLRRISPRTMSLLKFSSAANRSTGFALTPAGEEAVADASRIEASLVLFAGERSLALALGEVRPNLGLVAEVVRNHRVDVRQGNRRVLLGDLLRGRARLESRHERVQHHPGAADPDHTIGVGLDRDPLRWSVQFHKVSVGRARRAVNGRSRSREVPFGEGTAGAGLEVSLEPKRVLFARELQRHDQFPRPVLGRV